MAKSSDVSVDFKSLRASLAPSDKSPKRENSFVYILLQFVFLSICVVALIYILFTMNPVNVKFGYFEWEKSDESFRLKSNIFAGRLLNSIASHSPLSSNKLIVREGNLAICPYTISVSLALLMEGSKFRTREEIVEILEWKHFSNYATNTNLAMIVKTLKRFELKRNGTSFSFGSRIFVDKSFKVTKKYKCIASERFNASIIDIDINNAEISSKIVNDWISIKTKQRITELVQPESFTNDLRFFLATVVFFNEKWLFQFSTGNTKISKFLLNTGQTKYIKMMHLQTELNTGYFKNFQILELPYADNETSMVILLPDELTTLKKAREIFQDKNIDVFNDLFTSTSKQQVIVALPKFKFDIKTDLKRSLMELGIKRLFSPYKGNFDGIIGDATNRIHVSDFFNRIQIEIEEKGTVAAEAMAVKISERSQLEDVVEFNANRPFLFFIKNKLRNFVLFIGQIADPSQFN